MKWEPVAAMIALIALGVWLVGAPAVRHDLREGAQTVPLRIGGVKGDVEVVTSETGEHTFRLLFRDQPASDVLTSAQFIEKFGAGAHESVVRNAGNAAFRVLNISNWWGLGWVLIGFGGQAAFFGRMAIQWVVSERRRDSVVPEAFWWLSLAGGVALFTYFVWRQDIVGVLGQSSGVVIYARNLRLIHKRRRRQQREEDRRREKEGPVN